MKYWTVLSVLVLSTCNLTLEANITAIVDEIYVDKDRNFTINSTTEYILSVNNLTSDLSKFPPRIHVECFYCNKVSPAIVIFKQKSSVTSFELPISFKLPDHKYVVFNKTERTLCSYEGTGMWRENQCGETISDLAGDGGSSTLVISLSTSSKSDIVVNLKVMQVDDFLLELDMNKTIELTPASPSFYLYEFSNDTEETDVILQVESEFNNCMIVSIQNRSCPLVDTGVVYYTGFFQTVTLLGGMTIKREMFPNGFYAVFSLRADDSYCLSSVGLKSSQRSKIVVVSLHKSITTEHYLYVVVGTLGGILLVYAVMLCLTHYYFMRKDLKLPELEICDMLAPSTSDHFQRTPTVNDSDNMGTLKVTSPNTDDTLSIKTDSSLDETDLDVMTDVELDKNIFRTKVTLYLSDLSKKNPTVLKKKSELYFWNLMTIAIFYGLPASQLVITYQSTLLNSGNEDLCYYNFLCSHPLGSIFDFNHIFSNIGYVALGILFIIITRRKDRVHGALVCQDSRLDRYALVSGMASKGSHQALHLFTFELIERERKKLGKWTGQMTAPGIANDCHSVPASGDKAGEKFGSTQRNYGVPQHFGLYYAMGTSLIIEGLLSACYHVCPNIYNFQFDASFMYIISTLCMIKIYQSRHPDVNATAYSTFFLIAFVLFLGICGMFTSFSLLFWIVFTTLHIGTLLYISLHIYYVGRFEFDWRAVVRYFKQFQFCVCRTAEFWCPLYPKRFCLIAIMNLCNWALAITALVIGVKDVSSYLILIFIANLMLYTTFYIIMKILSGEKILFQPCLYILLAVVSWSAALFYFFHKTISWKKTPAESRMYNKPCELFDFYDNHDIWHFISSGGLFFSFLVLLTLDDDLIFVHRSKIPVF